MPLCGVRMRRTGRRTQGGWTPRDPRREEAPGLCHPWEMASLRMTRNMTASVKPVLMINMGSGRGNGKKKTTIAMSNRSAVTYTRKGGEDEQEKQMGGKGEGRLDE